MFGFWDESQKSDIYNDAFSADGKSPVLAAGPRKGPFMAVRRIK